MSTSEDTSSSSSSDSSSSSSGSDSSSSDSESSQASAAKQSNQKKISRTRVSSTNSSSDSAPKKEDLKKEEPKKKQNAPTRTKPTPLQTEKTPQKKGAPPAPTKPPKKTPAKNNTPVKKQPLPSSSANGSEGSNKSPKLQQKMRSIFSPENSSMSSDSEAPTNPKYIIFKCYCRQLLIIFSTNTGKFQYLSHLNCQTQIQNQEIRSTNPSQKVPVQESNPDQQPESHQIVKEKIKHKENNLVFKKKKHFWYVSGSTFCFVLQQEN